MRPRSDRIDGVVPRTAILYIAERCNQRCVFCLEEEGKWSEFVDPSTQQVYDVLARLKGRGAEHITFMGGETFFRKDLPKILRRAKDVGYTRVGVTTNGTVLSKGGFVQRLVDSGLDFIEMSVHGHTEELANQISRSSVTFKRQRQALDEIVSAGPLFTIVNVVVCRENANHLVDVVRYVREGWPSIPMRFKLKFVSLQGWALERAEAGDISLGYEEVDFVTVGDYLEAEGVPFWYYNVPLCRLGRHAHRSHELATLATDETYFDLDHRGPSEYFDSGHQFDGRIWPRDPCAACTLRPVCCGIEESHRRARGTAALSARSDGALPLVELALADRGQDPAHAARRLAVLERAARPERFVQVRPDGALRFLHEAEDLPLDLLIESRAEDAPAFAKTARFSLSYRARTEADRNPPAGSPLVVLLEHAARALEEADALGLDLDRARVHVSRLRAPGWRLDGPPQIPVRRKGELRVLNLERG